MLEHDLNPAATKFIASLVKSLQILCNGQVDFNESIELIGHINVRVDHIHKINYIVDEHVSKEGSDSSTTFLSNSYHSFPPTKSLPPPTLPVSQPDPQPLQHQQHLHQNVRPDIPAPPRNTHAHTVKVTHKLPNMDSSQKQDNVMVKMEGSDNDCMVLPASPEDYEQVEDIGQQEGGSLPGTSSAPSEPFEMEYDMHNTRAPNQTGKKRKADDQSSMPDLEMEASDVVTTVPSSVVASDSKCVENNQVHSSLNISEGVEKPIDLEKLTKDTLAIPQSVNLLKENITHIASMLNLQVVPNDGQELMNLNTPFSLDIKNIKKQFQENMDKDRIQKLKKLLKMKNGKRKKQEFRSLIAESGLNEDLLRSLTPDFSLLRRKYKVKDEFSKSHKKSYRLRAQERQQKLLEMAENLKRSKGYNGKTVVVSRIGNKKISLQKSNVSIFSYQTQLLNLETVDDAAEALSGRMNKFGRHTDKSREKKSLPTPKSQHLKRKMRHLVTKITKDINDAGYRVTFSSTIGSDVEFHSADLTVVPISVDELFPDVKDDPKLEISEEDYAKQLEREHFVEKQKANEGRMKELEVQLTQILSGVEEVFVNKRKRYGLSSIKPTDAERMKLFRKKLKEDPGKYQDYKQKRALTTKKRRLGTLAAKVKETSAAAMTTNDVVSEESHTTPNLSLPQTLPSVNIHCPQGYVHPSTHQPPAPTVNILNTGQYVAQVPGMQPGHQHQQNLPYTSEMDIVELIAATHNVQNQHFDPEEGSSDSKAARGDGKSSGGKRGASELIGKFAAYECSYCSVILTEYEDLTLHSKNCPSPSCSMICLTCGEKLPNKPEMRQHLKLVHSHKTFGCKYCDMMFLSSSGLLSHTKAKHRPDAKTLCQLCGQAFHNKANLEGHMNMHLGIRPFKCKRCGKSYGHSKSLITHEKMCKSIISSPKTVTAKGLGSQSRGHMRGQINKPNSNTSMKQTISVQEIPKKDIERKDMPSTPVPTESSQPQIVYETYQPTFVEGREEKRDANASERTMTLIPNANQNFTFTTAAADAASYPQSFPEPVSQPSLVMTAMNSPNPANVQMANPVYAHPNTSFVLPQVAYGMYQQGILPDQR